jgi:5-formyltetrahydrofolate cyclo-ligase
VSGLPSHRLKQAKRALRRAVLERRDALPVQDRRAMSDRIAERLLAMPEAANVRTALAFWSFGSEVDTAPVIHRLRDRGVRTALPRIEGGDVVAVPYEPGDPVAATAFGAMEPTTTALVAPADLDLVIVPGVAFDVRGARVGYGGGFYDRLLPTLRAGVPTVAIAFALQIVPEVPEGGVDRRVDAIVTEDEVIRCRT